MLGKMYIITFSKKLIAILNLKELLRLTWAIHVILTDLLQSLILCKFK